MIKLQLIQNKIALLDDDMKHGITDHKWQAYQDKGSRWYAIRHARKNGTMTTFRMHRVVYEVKTGYKLSSYQHIDHINSNSLDNRIENLRIATASQNAANRVRSTKRTSEYKGVYFNKTKGKFQAQIQKDYIKYNLGYFYDEVEAAEAYDRNALTMFGEYAHINFPKLHVRKIDAGLEAATA